MSVLSVDITHIVPVAEGASFGGQGPYELVTAVAHLAVDPNHSANAFVCDLGRAETVGGEVRFESDVVWLRPVRPPASSKLLAVVPNRGLTGSVPFSRELQQLNFGPDLDIGDGHLLRDGWSVLWTGWQCDVIRAPGSVGVEVPVAREANGQPVTGTMRVEFLPLVETADHDLADSSPFFSFRPYPSATTDNHRAVLTVRTSAFGQREVIDRSRWRFARTAGGDTAISGTVVSDPSAIWLEGGFQPFHIYEVVYETDHAPVVGLGLCAMRDVVSHVAQESGATHTIGVGVSQSGRFLRQMLHDGADVDETGRRVFDGLFIDIAGARRGEFNHRFAQPSVTMTAGLGHLPPYAVGDLIPNHRRSAPSPPRVFNINSAFEYWRGDAALVHCAPDGAVVDEPTWARTYLLSGVDHMGNTAFKELLPGANPVNTVDAGPVRRALFDALAQWVAAGVEPPPSQVPRRENNTLVDASEVLDQTRLAAGAAVPDHDQIPRVRVLDFGPATADGVGRWPPVAGREHRSWVSAVDADGNEVAGIRVPAVAVPLATHLGWNPCRIVEGLPTVLLEFVGSSLPFAANAAERAATGDPRPSVAERYADRDTYTACVRATADALARDRFLLAADIDPIVDDAVGAYDRLQADVNS